MPIGGEGGDVTTSDVDNDGDVDIIATTRNPFSIWVFINQGAGVFADAIEYQAGLRPRAVIAADLNNDGEVDMVTANQLGGGVTVMTGDGTGAFAFPMHISTASDPMELAFGDFNGDTLIDLAVTHTSNSAGPLVVLINKGGVGAGWLKFETPVSYQVGMGSRSVQTVDIDGDGELDLIATNRDSNNLSVLTGNGDGTFNPGLVISTGPSPRDSAVGDFNGDGLLDVAVANFNSGAVRVLINQGSDMNGWLGLVVVSGWNTMGSGPHGIATADLELDSDLDLLVVNVQSGDQGLSVMLNNGTGGYADTTIEATNAFSAASVAVADLNGNGNQDVVNSNASNSGSITIHLNITETCPNDANGDGFVDTADLGILLGSFGTTNGHVDLNGDGVVDTADLGILLSDFGVCP
jgi:hypothetical protein